VSELQALYQDTIRRHAAQPVGRNADIRATHQHELFNAQCGDRVHVKLRDGAARPADPLAPLAGVRPYPSRVHCALLPWRAAERALQQDSDPA
jgi:NifU-like protein involved in Fe-S cluster formation